MSLITCEIFSCQRRFRGKENIIPKEKVSNIHLGQGIVGFAFYCPKIEPINILNIVNYLSNLGCICNPVDEGVVIAGLLSTAEQLQEILKIQAETNFQLGLGLPMLRRNSGSARRLPNLEKNQITPENVNVIFDSENNFIDIGGSTITGAVRALQNTIKNSSAISVRRLNPESKVIEIKASNVDVLNLEDVFNHLKNYQKVTKIPPRILLIAKKSLVFEHVPINFSGLVLDIDVVNSTGLVEGHTWQKRAHKELYLLFKQLEKEVREKYGINDVLFGVIKTTESLILYVYNEEVLNLIRAVLKKIISKKNIKIRLNVHQVENAILYVRENDQTVIASSNPIK